MITLPLTELVTVLNLKTANFDGAFTGIAIDSRTVKPGNLFVAIKGERFDGHDYVAQAFANGAQAALVERDIAGFDALFIVDNVILALGQLTAHWRAKFNLPIIAVTGSNGKTTLKNMIAAILIAASDESQVLATPGNFNNEIGLPLTLGALNSMHKYAVVELGMNHTGELAYLSPLVQPKVAVINNAAASHLAGVGGDVTGVAKAKGEIFVGLQKDGMAILNRDDDFFEFWCELTNQFKRMTFGFSANADVRAVIKTQTPTHQLFTLTTPIGEIDIHLPLTGKHNIKNALSAAASALAIGIDLVQIKAGLENVAAAKGRMNVHPLENGAKIIDDTYNANPFSLTAALETLDIYAGKKILVLGDMRELGETELALHAQAGNIAKSKGVHTCLTLGELSRQTSAHFGNNAWHFTDKAALIAALTPMITSDTVVLIKGSRSMKMEQIVAALLASETSFG